MLLGCEFYRCVFRLDNDFLWHRNLGIAFIRDQVYETFAYHYPPARAMIDAATAWMPYRLDRAIWLIATCTGFVWCVKFWSRLRAARGRGWYVGMGRALAVTACYLQRDLAECGLQLFLLLLLSTALWGLLQGRPALCGWSLGLAAVYKVTPAIFLPYLIWKRQWRPQAAWPRRAYSFACCRHSFLVGRRTSRCIRSGLLSSRTLWRLKILRKTALKCRCCATSRCRSPWRRMVQDYPEGHPLYLKAAAAVRLANLDVAETKQFVRVVLVVLALALAWRFRRRVDFVDGTLALANEWAAVCILVAMLSPMCWLQHMVLVVPAALLFAHAAAAGELRRWQWCVGTFAAALALLIHRDLIGVAMCDLFSCYQPHTMAAMLLLGLVLSPSRPAVAARSSQETGEASSELDADHDILPFPYAGRPSEGTKMPPERQRRADAA